MDAAYLHKATFPFLSLKDSLLSKPLTYFRDSAHGGLTTKRPGVRGVSWLYALLLFSFVNVINADGNVQTNVSACPVERRMV